MPINPTNNILVQGQEDGIYSRCNIVTNQQGQFTVNIINCFKNIINCCMKKLAGATNNKKFLLNCKKNNLLPTFLNFNTHISTFTHQAHINLKH